MRRRELAAALAGPLLIAASVLILLHGFLLGRMNLQHVDPLAFFLPTHCFLGESLARGDIPLWNPHVLGGAPFAADPQSGWMYLPAMALYTLAPCHLALPWFVALQPMLAGLGVYWFLRSEGLSRPASTLGGLMLALAMSSSRVAVTLPFAGALAWTSLMLAAASRYLRTGAWSSRAWWGFATAACWGQVAAAHLSHGLVVATGVLLAYGAARSVAAIRTGEQQPGMWLRGGLLIAALPLVNLAFLLPRLAYLPRTNLAIGYDGMERLASELAGGAPEAFTLGAAVSPPWVLGFATSPGAYLGIAWLSMALFAWRLRRTRALVAGLSAFGIVCYLLSLHAVAGAVERFVAWMPFADFYLHEPARFRYGVLLTLPILAAVGFEAWREEPGRWRSVAVGAAALLALPLLSGVSPARLALPFGGAVAAGAFLWHASRTRRLVAVLPALAAIELVANGFVGQARPHGLNAGGERPLVNVPFTHLVHPTFRTMDYFEPSAFAARIARSGERYASLATRLLTERGYLESQEPGHWGLLANQRGMLLGLEDAGGYNPAQLLGTWMFLRASSLKEIKYNAGFLGPRDLTAAPGAREVPALDLLDVGWIVAPAGEDVPGGRLLARDGPWGLFRMREGAGRASVVSSWRVVEGGARAVGLGVSPFAPDEVALERSPGIGEPARRPARPAGYEPSGSETVGVTASGPGVVLLRNAFDPGWRAWVNGREAPVLRAEGFLQAVPIGPGRASVALRYEDPWVYRGLGGSTLVVLGIALAGVLARRRERSAPGQRRGRSRSGGGPGDQPADPRG